MDKKEWAKNMLNKGYSEEAIITAGKKLTEMGKFSDPTNWAQDKTYFGDQRKEEGAIEQAGKGLIRGPMSFAQNAIAQPENIAQGAMNLLDKTVGEGILNPALNAIGGAVKSDYKPLPTLYNDIPSENQWTENVASNIVGAGKEALTTDKTYDQARQDLATQQYNAGKDQGIGGSLANIAGGAVGSAFNIMAPGVSAGFTTASEMPGAQYLTQGIGAITQKPIDYLTQKAGGTEETAQQLGTVANLALPLGRGKIAEMKPTSTPGKMLQSGSLKVADAILDPLGTTAQTAKFLGNKAMELPGKVAQVPGKVVETVKNVGNTISDKYMGAREYLSGLEPKEATALGKTSVEEFDTILNRAKEAVGPNADYTQTPYYVFDEASNALSKIDDNLSTRQAERIAILDEAPIATVDATDARNTLRSSLRSINVADIRMVDGVPTIIPVKGREALLDMTNPSDVKALQKLNEILDGDVSPTQTMDRIKKLQEWAYENKSTIGVKGTSERMNKLIKQVQGSLNSTFKKQLPEEYTKVLESMSEDIKLSDDVKRLFGIDDTGNQVGNRGELLMKRILSGTTTGGEARSLADRILKRYGIDFTRQARLRQLAMDLVGDDRGKTLFQSIKEGKNGIVDIALQKTIGKVVDKEGVARNLAKGQGDTIMEPKPLYTPNTFRKAMAEDARKPLALPAPSGQPVSAKSVNLNPITGTPKIQGEVGKQGMRPGTTKKQELKKQESMKLLPSPRLPEGTSFPRTDIVAESMQGLSSNVKRPNGTPLRNNQDISPSTNTQGSKQTLKPSSKPLKTTSTNDKKGVVVPEKGKKLAMSKKTGTESKGVENGGKPIVNPNKTTNDKQQMSKSDAGDTIPEGYFKNMFGEIIKKPSNKTGGFIKIPEVSSPPKKIQDFDKKDTQTVYHGSRYDFDTFDVSKIYSGEGNTGFGEGIYFASKDSAKGYADKLETYKGEGKVYKAIIPADKYLLDLDKTINEQGPYIQTSIQNILKKYKNDLKGVEGSNGRSIYQKLEEVYGSTKATEILNENGIKGNVFNFSEGERYQVIFDNNFMKNDGTTLKNKPEIINKSKDKFINKYIQDNVDFRLQNSYKDYKDIYANDSYGQNLIKEAEKEYEQSKLKPRSKNK